MAIELFSSDVETSRDIWCKYLNDYEKTIVQLSNDKRKPELIELDSFWRSKLKDTVQTRCPTHIELKELSMVMRWKLQRGKMRPLQRLVDSNTNDNVIAASTKAFHELTLNNWKEAMDALCTLKGLLFLAYRSMAHFCNISSLLI